MFLEQSEPKNEERFIMRISLANNKFRLKFKASNSNTVENNRLREKRLNIRDRSNHVRIFKVINFDSNISFSSNTISARKRVNVLHNFTEIKPSVSKENQVVVFRFK